MIYTFDQPFRIVEGFESATIIHDGRTIDFRGGNNTEEGILEFTGPIRSLTVDSGIENPGPGTARLIAGQGVVAFAVPFGFNNGVVTMVGIALFAGLKGLEHLRKGRNRNKDS